MFMLKNRDIIVFSDDWGRHPSSCQHIVKHLLPENRVLWVNTIGIRSPQLTAYDIKRSFEKLRSWLSETAGNGKGGPDSPVIVSPVIIPYNAIGPVRRFNKHMVVRSVRGAMAQYDIKRPIVITTFPTTVDYLNAFDEIAHVYYCVDDFTSWPGVDRDLIKRMEDRLLIECDLTLATSEELCRKKVRKGRKPSPLFHGVDFEHFSTCRIGTRASAVRHIPSPVIGFFGAVSAWLDFTLLTRCAAARPAWSFVFVGPVDTDVRPLSAFSNVHCVGNVPYEELPAYAASFDVALIPFAVNELTRNVNPLKLLEYLACGLPVVSTDMPEVRKFSDVISIAKTPEAFLAAIERALANDSPELRAARRERARHYSWKAVAEELSAYISKVLQQKRLLREKAEREYAVRRIWNRSER